MSYPSNIVKILASLIVAGALVVEARHLYMSHTQTSAVEKKNLVPAGIIKYDANAPQLNSLKVTSVSEVPLPISDMINGRITYDENITSRVTSPIAGRVNALHAEIGDTVQSGTVLADIDSPDLATADADWRKAQADELRKKLAYDRAKTLFEGDVMARKDYESAEADYLQSQAETKRTHLRMKNLNASGTENGRFGLKSPIRGVISDKQINLGQEVRPDLPNPLFTISDLSHLWVIVDVPENIAPNIHIGQKVRIETDAYPDDSFMGQVTLVGLALDPTTRRIQVRCAIDNRTYKLKPEMFARVSFIAENGEKKAILIPNTSVFEDGMYSYVFVEKQQGTFEKRRVHVKLKSYDKSYIDNGLASNDKVVTEGAFLLNAEVANDAH